MTNPSHTSAPATRAHFTESSHVRRAWYAREPWLTLLLLAFGPLVLSFAATDTLRTILLVAAGVLAVAGLVLLFVQHRRDGEQRPEWADAE
jgi:hypothetical protein